MIRKLVVRLLLCFVALISVVVLSVCIAGWLAFRQPAFYADLRAQQFTKSDRTAAKEFSQRMEKDLRRWKARSLALQRRQLSTPPATAPLDAPLTAYDPQQDTHSITITEKQINVQLASRQAIASGKFRNARVQMKRDCICLAFEVAISEATCVLSMNFKPTMTPAGRLRVDLMSARIGQLPLPLKPVLGLLPRDVHYVGSDMELDLTAPNPHVCLISDNDPEDASVKSIKCSDGKLTIEFRAPVLKCQQDQQDQHATTPLAVSQK